MISTTAIVYAALVMGALGLVFGALLAFASIKFYVPVDSRALQIRELLPGANCGGCGFPGCDGYADGIVGSGARTNLCAAGGSSLAAAIATIMGVDAESSEPVRAFLQCQGSPDKSPRNAIYEGIRDCRSAAILPGGSPSACPFGCMGLGTCVKVCVFDALRIEDGIVRVDATKCVGCGTCTQVCPNSVITLIPRSMTTAVACKSSWRGPNVKKVCSIGCIGCGLCVRNCPESAITMKNNLAEIDPHKCNGCGACLAKCPAGSIVAAASCPEEKKSAA